MSELPVEQVLCDKQVDAIEPPKMVPQSETMIATPILVPTKVLSPFEIYA